MKNSIYLKSLKILKQLTVVLILCFAAGGLLNSQTALAALQQSTYSGTVNDPNGNVLPGVTVVIKGTTNGTVTNIDGKYNLQANPGDVLIFSFIGYVTQEVEAGNASTIDVVLSDDVVGLEEVVVVGYGVAQKQDLTGATTTVSSDEMNQGAITNPLQQVAGRAAGVNVTQVGSEPGSTPSVRIRGITSLIGGNDPLVVVDGIQGNMDLLNQVPPSEIASIDILKDASATAIYGSRGAPGVILVTTKKNDKGQSTMEYHGTASVDMLSNRLETFTASEWREMAQVWGVPYSADHGSDTDWYDILVKNGTTQNHTISMGGSAKNFNYRASATAILQEGLVLNTRNHEYMARVQATQKALDDKLTLSVNLNSGVSRYEGNPASVGRAAFRSNLVSNAYWSKPTDPVLFQDGSYFYDEDVFQYINPYAVAQEVINESETHNMFGSLRADFEVFKGISLGWFGSWRKVDINRGYYEPVNSTLPNAIDHNGVANVTTNLQDEKLMDISLNFNKEFGKHGVKGVAVYEWQRQTYQGHFAQARGFINDITTYNALQLGTISNVLPGDITSYKNDRTLISFLGRLNYSFNGKYLLTVSVRHDGSSVFGANHKWGTFPSASAAWRISEEPFMKSIEAISYLKLRAGYGITGNQQGLYPQQSMQLIGESGVTNFNGELITNFAVTQNANEDLQWETRYQTNVGLDFGFFGGKLNGSVDVFSAVTENLLFNYTVPQPPYPFSSIAANVGSLKNEGIELVLNYRLVNTNDWEVTLGGNLSLLRNEVLELSGTLNGIPLMTDYVGMGYNAYLIEGQPIGVFNILQHEGRNESNAETVVDRNDDGIIDQGDRSEDRYFAGSALPTYTYAFIPEVKYKNFDLSMVWRGSGGNMIYNSIKSSFSYFENLGKSNLLRSAAELGLYTSQYSTDLWLEKGDYLRFDNLTIGYTINTEKIDYIKSMRFSLTGNNLAVFTQYTGLDPEIRVDGGNGSGADAGIYPRVRSISAGLNIIF
ncbi:MAG: SusC/RagA family TonB-linked outer membrane protein [Prolixibacteraceae bacterium]|nr:SusC/RagA family TonB-linked outer membrane protein [Prolixibacteraceae bacterium]